MKWILLLLLVITGCSTAETNTTEEMQETFNESAEAVTDMVPNEVELLNPSSERPLVLSEDSIEIVNGTAIVYVGVFNDSSIEIERCAGSGPEDAVSLAEQEVVETRNGSTILEARFEASPEDAGTYICSLQLANNPEQTNDIVVNV